MWQKRPQTTGSDGRNFNRTDSGWSRRAAFVVSGIFLTAIGQAQASPPAIEAVAKPSRPAKVMLYAAVGPVLTQYDVDVDAAALVQRDSVTLPGNVQYAWPHPSRRYLYVAWSRGTGQVAPGSGRHGVSAFRIDPAIASSVIITTFTDVFGFFSFLGLATLLIRFLL